MTIGELLQSANLPSLDREMLLCHVLSSTRTEVFTHSSREIEEKQQNTFQALVSRRKSGEPIAYIIGKKDFYGREFIVNPSTLIPRPSTEILIDCVRDFLQEPKSENRNADSEIVIVVRKLAPGSPGTILDIGTGSGNVAATLALEHPGLRIVGIDTSASALAVAKKNCLTLGAKNVELIEGDGVTVATDMREPFLLVSNPPYIPAGTRLMKDVSSYEPESALFSGALGLDLITALTENVARNHYCRGMIVECRSDQINAIDTMLNTEMRGQKSRGTLTS